MTSRLVRVQMKCPLCNADARHIRGTGWFCHHCDIEFYPRHKPNVGFVVYRVTRDGDREKVEGVLGMMLREGG